MKITETRLRRIIREELISESEEIRYRTDQYYKSKLFIERTINLALQKNMNMSGEDMKLARQKMIKSMGSVVGRNYAYEVPADIFDIVVQKLLSSANVSSVMQEDFSSEVIKVTNCPGWPSVIAGKDLYHISKLVSQIPSLSAIRKNYDLEYSFSDETGAVSRGLVFMVFDMILNSSPHKNAAFYIDGPDMLITLPSNRSDMAPGLTLVELEEMTKSEASES